MAEANYYLITALPTLGEPPSAPPLGPIDLLEHLRDSVGPSRLVETIFLGDDLLQREAYLAGEIKQVSPAVLTVGQIQDDEPLPVYLVGGEEESPTRIAADVVWAAYFRHAADVARQQGSGFLAAWIRYEVALRNALAEARAKALNLEPADYLVAVELTDDEEDFTALVGEWAAAADPLAGMKVLDEARWEWLTAHDAWFSFADDELAAYAAKLMLLIRWNRLTASDAEDAQARGENKSS